MVTKNGQRSAGPSPLSLARQAGDASPAARYLLRASEPWSPGTHHLFPDGARVRAVSLVRIGFALSRKSFFAREEHAFMDVWLTIIMPDALARDDDDRAPPLCPCAAAANRASVLRNGASRKPHYARRADPSYSRLAGYCEGRRVSRAHCPLRRSGGASLGGAAATGPAGSGACDSLPGPFLVPSRSLPGTRVIARGNVISAWSRERTRLELKRLWQAASRCVSGLCSPPWTPSRGRRCAQHARSSHAQAVRGPMLHCDHPMRKALSLSRQFDACARCAERAGSASTPG